MTGDKSNSKNMLLDRRQYLKAGLGTTAVSLSGCLRLSQTEAAQETPADTPTETNASATTPTEAPQNPRTEAPQNRSTETPQDTQTETPQDTQTETPQESDNTFTTVRGRISSAVGVSLDGYEVEILNETNREVHHLTILDGQFRKDVAADSFIRLTFYYSGDRGFKSGFDGVPVLYPLSTGVGVSGAEEDLGQFELPQAYRTEIRIVDQNGNPVEDFGVQFFAPTNSGTNPRTFTTNADGYVKHISATKTGVDLVGNVNVVRGDNRNSVRELNVTEKTEYTITIS